MNLEDGKGRERERKGGRKTSVRSRLHRKYSSGGFGGECESSTKVCIYMYIYRESIYICVYIYIYVYIYRIYRYT